jgi:hypothetical protein
VQWELKCVGIIGLVYIIVVPGAWYTTRADDRFAPFIHLLIMLMGLAQWYISLFRPLALHYRPTLFSVGGSTARSAAAYSALPVSPANSNGSIPAAAASAATAPVAERETSETIPYEIATLSRILSCKPGRAAFTQHLVLEFALENLMMVDAVDTLRAALPPGAAPTPVAPPTVADLTAAAAAAAAPSGLSSSSGFGAGAGAASASGVAVGVLLSPSAAASASALVDDVKRPEVTPEEAHARAAALYDRFVAPGAPFEVNLSYHHVDPLKAEFGGAAARARRAAKGQGGTSGGSKTGGAAVSARAHDTGGAAVASLPGGVPNEAGPSHAPSRPPAVRAGFGTAASGGGGPIPVTIAPENLKPAAYYLTLFDRARADVFRLLETDSLPRFQNSLLFYELRHNILLARRLNPSGRGMQPATAADAGAPAAAGSGSAPKPAVSPAGGASPSPAIATVTLGPGSGLGLVAGRGSAASSSVGSAAPVAAAQ